MRKAVTSLQHLRTTQKAQGSFTEHSGSPTPCPQLLSYAHHGRLDLLACVPPSAVRQARCLITTILQGTRAGLGWPGYERHWWR